MDKKYLEFWGNIFLDAARNQQMLEDLAQWSKAGFAMMETQMATFRKYSGFGRTDEPDAGVKSCQDLFLEFKKSYKDLMTLMGVVPKEDYDEVVSKYEALKREIAEKKSGAFETAGVPAYDQDAVFRGIQDLIRTQTEQFQHLLQAFSPESPASNQSRRKGKGRKQNLRKGSR
jgi:hypothetical protein